MFIYEWDIWDYRGLECDGMSYPDIMNWLTHIELAGLVHRLAVQYSWTMKFKVERFPR